MRLCYRTIKFGVADEGIRRVFACALTFSPVRMAGQTACPEESLARARKRCGGMYRTAICKQIPTG